SGNLQKAKRFVRCQILRQSREMRKAGLDLAVGSFFYSSFKKGTISNKLRAVWLTTISTLQKRKERKRKWQNICLPPNRSPKDIPTRSATRSPTQCSTQSSSRTRTAA